MAGRYDRINGAYCKVKKRYARIGGAWTPVKKRFDKVNGVWVPSYSGGIRWNWSVGGYYPSADYWNSAGATAYYALYATKTATHSADDVEVAITYIFDDPITFSPGLGPNNEGSINVSGTVTVQGSQLNLPDRAYCKISINGELPTNPQVDLGATGTGRFTVNSETLVSSITLLFYAVSGIANDSMQVWLSTEVRCNNWQKIFYLNNSGEYDG